MTEKQKQEILNIISFWCNENMGNRTNKMLADILLNSVKTKLDKIPPIEESKDGG